MDVLADIRASKMTPLQIRAIAIALALIILDGFEIAVMSFAAKPMSDEWGVGSGTLGVVLSGSLFGMAAGAILFSPFGDRYGRRTLTIVSMSMVVVGMVLAVISPNVATMIVARVITGLGIGAMSQLNAYVSEFASEKRRGTVVGIYATGFPIGAALAGVVAGLFDPADWKNLFVVGTVLSVALLVLAWVALPESIDFLVARRPKNALERINSMLGKMDHPALKELPEQNAADRHNARLGAIFTGTTGIKTLALWLGYACLMAAYYFANSWIPKLVAESTGDVQSGTTVGTVLNLGGIIGSLLFAAAAFRWIPRNILMTTLGFGAIGYAVYGAAFGVGWLAITLGIFLGIVAVGSVAGFYAVGPTVYPASLRGTGVGWMVGVGRLVSIISPIGTGFLLESGWTAGNLFYLMAMPLAVGTVCIVILGRIQQREESAIGGPVAASNDLVSK
ncbi:MFS transporter [Rhodococcus sp. NPDC047139]|uniref:MFS transporter n=1 Tax=Rhodococcus sp. NPDC047139 TaxID=3155141 RepID=UPI0033DC68E9